MIPPRPSYFDKSACLGMDPAIFYPESDNRAQQIILAGPAKKVCKYCSVKKECLAFAIETGENQGVWGGMTPRERNEYAAKKKLPVHSRNSYRNRAK